MAVTVRLIQFPNSGGGGKSDILHLELRREGETLTVWQEELSKRLQEKIRRCLYHA